MKVSYFFVHWWARCVPYPQAEDKQRMFCQDWHLTNHRYKHKTNISTHLLCFDARLLVRNDKRGNNVALRCCVWCELHKNLSHFLSLYTYKVQYIILIFKVHCFCRFYDFMTFSFVISVYSVYIRCIACLSIFLKFLPSFFH